MIILYLSDWVKVGNIMEEKAKYEQFVEVLQKNIHENIYPYGTCIPSERELAEQFNLNRSTIRHAITFLVKEGSLKKVQGKGTYVMKYNINESDLKFRGMSSLLEKAGYHPSSKIIDSQRRKANFKYSKIFHLEEDQEVFRIMRIRYGNNEPIALETTSIPFDIIKDIDEIDFQVYSLYDMFAYNHIKLSDINHQFSLTKLRSEAKLLQLKPGSSVISILITATDENGKVIEYTEAYVRSEYCQFYTDCIMHEGKVKIYAQDY